MSVAIDPALLPKVTLYACCACCVADHTQPHSDGCGKHQRTEMAEAARAKRKRRPVETVELPS